MNILFILLDTLRADHLSCYGYPKETSPNLDALAREGVLGENLFCPAIPTQPSHTTMFTGQFSITHQIVTHGGTKELSSDAPWLQRELQKAGFTTVAVDNLWKMKPWFSRGYEFYIDPSHRHHYMQMVSADIINSRLIPWLRHYGRDLQPWFLFVHYWDPHTPYIVPEKGLRWKFYGGKDPTDPKNESLKPLRRQIFWEWWKGWFHYLSEEELKGHPITDAEFIVAQYDAEIYFVDKHVGDVLNELEELGLADDTFVLITSDHGESMTEHDIFFDHHGLYECTIHVPLIVRWRAGGIAGGRRIPHTLQNVDIAPTLLEAAGVKVPEAMEGKSWLALFRGESKEPLWDVLITQECTYQAKWAIRTSEWKFILAREPDFHNTPMRELYHLPTDPGETRNLYLERFEVARELEGQLEGWIRKMMEKNGLNQDPLVEQGITIGKRWKDWIEKHRYW